ncbi:MAG: hypothetical protein CBD88_08850 [Flavobacteriales bacterium TMED228]|nr:MAG: hypothetical protein CBD88_08850 [Flavobacteriales bacterium TMED228]
MINIHSFLNSKYDTSIKILKGKQTIKNEKDYFVYNLSIIMSYLLQPTKKYGCKSKILFYHNCKSSNRIDRLLGKYNKDSLFKSLVDKSVQSYIRKYG